jgi:tRNA (adenine-N(1)-)-methyltransferase non-catalytic subunit
MCRLDKKDIGAMRRSAELSGSAIVEKLVEGSATFESKTGFSKAKYIRKKMQKHVHTVRVLQPTAFNMVQVYYSKHLPRIHRMRFDSLARLLTSSNVSASARVLCVDGCGGLVAGAILERLAPTAPAAAADAAASDGKAGCCARGGLVIAYPDQRAAIDAGLVTN